MNTHNYKLGDKVQCIKTYGSLDFTKGRIYTFVPDPEHKSPGISLIDNNGDWGRVMSNWYNACYFVKVDELMNLESMIDVVVRELA